MKRYVAYFRVSTNKQDYGIDAQSLAVNRYISSVGGELVTSFEEKETGKNNERPQMQAAIELCKAQKCTLVIAKLDRLSRNASFLMSLQDSNLDFVCCDMPSADRFTIGILALVAERERMMISQRTKSALEVCKARGITLGSPNPSIGWKIAASRIQERKLAFNASALKTITEIKETGVSSYNKLALCMNRRGEKTSMGKTWNAAAVKRVLATQTPASAL